MPLKTRHFLELALSAARVSDEKKASEVRVFDVHRFSTLADFYVLSTVDSSTQLQALHNHISQKVKDDFGLNPLRQDGTGSTQWFVLDYGGAVVHLMHRSARDFYALERLWEEARELDWKSGEPVKKPARARPAAKPRAKAAARAKTRRAVSTKR